MTYLTGRFVDSADAATLLRAEINTALSGHAAWQFVEEVTSGTTTARIWRNLGTANAWGVDWYLGVKWASGSNNTYFIVGEEWNGTGFIRPCPTPANAYTPSATHAAVSDTTAYGITSGTLNPGVFTTVDVLDTSYWIVITVNGFWCKTSIDTYGAYGGLFEPFFPDHPQEFPLVAQEIGNTDGDSGGSVARRPGVTTSQIDCFAIYSYATGATFFTPMMGTVPNGGYVMGGGRCYGTRWMVTHWNSVGGQYRGLMYDALVFTQSTGVSRGDTLSIEGQTYVCIDDGGTYGIWINTEAP